MLSFRRLRAAAEAAGMDTRDEAFQLALVIDPGSAHRRRLWEAWASDGRAGRWSAIIAAGAKIHADGLDRVSPYRRPKPLEYKQETRGGLTFNLTIDPEDEPQQPAVVA